MNQDEPHKRHADANDSNEFGSSEPNAHELQSESPDVDFYHELRDRLRDVSIPADLKTQLRSLPSQTGHAAPTNSSSEANVASSPASGTSEAQASAFQERRRFPAWIAVAAAVMLMAGGAIWMLNFDSAGGMAQPDQPDQTNSSVPSETDPNGGKLKANSTSDPISDPGNGLAVTHPSEASGIRARLDAIASIEAEIENLQISKLQRRLSGLQLASIDQSRQTRRADELTSIMAMADQAVLSFGGSRQLADADMRRLVERYPDSSGAQLARDFMSVQQP